MRLRRLVFCSIAIALAFVTSFIKLAHLPYGGSVTLFSMMFICLTGYWYGTGYGLLTGFLYGILQFLQEPYVLSLFQVGCDYLFAFTALGLTGLFRTGKNGLLKGYLTAVFVRGAFHSLGGYLYWMEYMPENFPESISFLYPVVYNYSYLLAEAVLTAVILLLPPVKNALGAVSRLALEKQNPQKGEEAV